MATPATGALDSPAAGPIEAARAAARDCRVTYWTGWLSPEMEGCSKEVFALKDHFVRSRIFGLSRYYTVRMSRRDRYFGLNARYYPLFRALVPLYTAATDVHHIYGGLGEWFFLRALRRKPIILTVAAETEPLDRSAYRYVHRFVTHSPRTAATLAGLGIGPERIRLIYPGLALDRFRPAARPPAAAAPWPAADPRRFRVLFATTPNTAEGMETRGVNLLVRAAHRLPDVDFLFVWRPWGDAQTLIDRCLDANGRPPNVHISVGVVPDMARTFQDADASIAPFTARIGGKICPTSLVESLASGRPVLVSTEVGIADLVREEGCGAVFPPTEDGLCAAIETLRAEYESRASRARPAAERHFDAASCFRAHERLYADAIEDTTPPC